MKWMGEAKSSVGGGVVICGLLSEKRVQTPGQMKT